MTFFYSFPDIDYTKPGGVQVTVSGEGDEGAYPGGERMSGHHALAYRFQPICGVGSVSINILRRELASRALARRVQSG